MQTHYNNAIFAYRPDTVVGTVKAPNFGPQENFGPLFQKGLLSSKFVLQKNEENKNCGKTLAP
jgi:hypothetical protein